ncbi:MAG: asparagine synthase-related protein [Gammaproteobacteria bacterium]|nr:asparagine synthase-related protein [Gammaproteobacteria bacterium]
MCGFSGILFSGPKAKTDFIPGVEGFRRAAKRVAHRGDTAHKESIHDLIWLNHFRLAFQDVESGAQPMLSDDKKHIIVFNGELYNHLSLRQKISAKTGVVFKTRSDTETILEAWKAFGEKIFEEFDGEYAFVICSLDGKQLIAHRDHYGVKPLFLFVEQVSTDQFACYQEEYHFQSSRLEFASEIKGLSSQKSWCREGLLRQFTGLYEPIRTPFENIIHIPAGGIFRVRQQESILNCTLITNSNPIRTESGNSHHADENDFAKVLQDSVSDRLLSDVELGIYQSGGVDSKVIAYELSKLSQQSSPVKSFTVGFAQSGYDETEEALSFANYLGFNPHVIKVDNAALNYSYPLAVETSELVQPFTNGAAKWWLSLFARQYVQGVFTGDGADEVFCGYPSYRYVNWWKSVMRGRGQAHSAEQVLELLDKKPLGQLRRDGLYMGRFSSHAKNPWLSGASAEGDGTDFINSIRILGVAHPLFGQIQAIATALLGTEAENWLTSQALSVQSWFCSGLPELKDRCCDPSQALLLWQNYFAKAHLPVLILNWVGDRMEMANTLEGRTPFMSKRLFQFMFSQPDRILVNGLRDKVLLRRTYANRFMAKYAKTPKKQFNAPFLNSEQLRESFGTQNIFEKTGLAGNEVFNNVIQEAERLHTTNPFMATHLRTVSQTAMSMSIVHKSLVENIPVERDKMIESQYLSQGGPISV